MFLFDAATSKVVGYMTPENGVTVDDYHGCDVAFDPTSSRVIGGGYGGLSIYDLAAGKRLD